MKHEFTTNDRSCSIKRHKISYDEIWSLGQQEAIRRLCVKEQEMFKGAAVYNLIPKFSDRARKIASVYAKFYLEQEEGCNPQYEGRFYWMGLAAFASKQVMCGLQFAESRKIRLLEPFTFGTEYITTEALGKGNFWLFQDIFVWHWFYANHQDCYEAGFGTRNEQRYISKDINPHFAVKDNVESLPWAEEALVKINHFKINDYVKRGFELVQEIEVSTGYKMSDNQLESLLQIANHEQLMILQPLIYDEGKFQFALDYQKLGERGLKLSDHITELDVLPRRSAAFSTACWLKKTDLHSDKLQVTMDGSGNLYDSKDRMSFIRNIAKIYHSNMQGLTFHDSDIYMREQLVEISSWSD